MQPRRLLIVQSAFLGDLVLTTPLLERLRAGLPDARITMVVARGNAPLLAGDPRVDEIDEYDKRPTIAGLRSYLRLVRRLRRTGFDVAIAAQRSSRTGWLIRRAAPLRIGFDGAPGAWAYTAELPWRAADHQADRLSSLADPLLGRNPVDVVAATRLLPGAAGARRASVILRRAGIEPGTPVVCLAPGSARPSKRWPVGAFASLADLIQQRGWRPIVIGAHTERALGERLRARCAHASPALLAGEVALAELPALIASCDALVGNDSAPAHIAAAVGTPVVTVFGPTAPSYGYAPRGGRVDSIGATNVPCRPCSPRGPRRCPRGDLRCLLELRPQDVFERLCALRDPVPEDASQLALLPG